MIIFPAIDLKNGKCVRLQKGDMRHATIFHHDPLQQAKIFSKAGFDWLHLIDLDHATGANKNQISKNQISQNQKIITALLEQHQQSVQIGGGIRSDRQIRQWLDKGAARVILGTLAIEKPTIAQQACRDFPNQIVVALDGAGDYVTTQGWQQVSKETIFDAARRVSNWGATSILYTNVERDGMKTGIDLERTLTLANISTIPVIASGGVAGIKDIDALIAQPKNIEGVIIGRALYDGLVQPHQLLQHTAHA